MGYRAGIIDRGVKLFLFEKIRGKDFIRLKKGERRVVFPKTWPLYLVNFDRSL